MLQIYIHGPKESGFIDLDPSFALDMESLSDAFDEELSTGTYSIPGEASWTEKTRRILLFAERIENGAKKDNYWICDVYDDGFPELIKAKFTILGKAGSWNYKKGKFKFSISGTKGLFGSAIKNKMLKDLSLGGIIAWEGMDSREFAFSHATGGQPKYPYIAFAPIAIENFIDEARNDFDNEFLAKDTVNNVIVTGAGTDDWIFGRPSSEEPTIAVASGEEEYIDYRTVPFFKMQYVFKKVFEEFGFKIIGEMIDDPAFANLLLFNNRGIEVYAPSINTDYNKKIVPADHLPLILIKDFIKAICGFLGVYPVFSDSNEVRMVFHTTNLSNKTIVSLNDVVTTEFESEFLDGSAAENGYKIAFTWDNADQYYSERVKDLSNKTKVGTVSLQSDLDVLDIGRTFTTDDIAFVASQNMWYQVANATTDPVLWDAYAENLDVYQKGAGEKTIDINLSTICQYVQFNSDTGLIEKTNYLGCRQPGSYITNKGALVTNPFGLRLFYASKQNINGVVIPVSYNHNRNNLNEQIEKYSLALTGNEGIAESFHVLWLEIIINGEVVKVEVVCNAEVKERLRKNNTFEINSTLFFLKHIEYTIPKGATMKLELVPL